MNLSDRGTPVPMKKPDASSSRLATPAPAEPRVGLRLRLWIACLAGGAMAGFGSLWVLGT
ncbi:MAG: hypothetical protein IT348_17970, partial [Candidatus Eisenbacteria bacterium]|nr:hypothetical protein [Candidatus Eisenbacteria bacterium]